MSLLSMLESFGKSGAAAVEGAPASSGFSLSSLLSGESLGKLEADAKAFVANAEKLFADVASSNGNVIAMVIALASDFKTVIVEVQEVKAILSDLQALTGRSVVVAPVAAVTHLAVAAVPSATPVAPTPAPVVFVASNPPADPFAPKPLAVAPVVSEPHGGA